MRVIREYWQCVGKQEIPLKELLDTVDTFLRSRGYSYRRLWSPTHPELSDTELKALFQKIPRPCNPPQVEALFEDVSWFGEEAEPMAYTGRQPFLCSGVRVVHCAGTSFCHVYFYIEVTGPDSPARIREENAVAAALKERFPKMRRENSYCLWSPEEAAGIAAANEALAPKLEEVKQSLPPFRERKDAPAEWAESLRQIGIYARSEKPAFSGKKLALSVFPKARYRYRHQAGSCFEMVRRTPCGNRLSVSFDSAPPAYVWQSASISLSGIKFCCPLFREQIWRENAETVRAFMEHCLLLAERAEAALDQPLYDCFGASPDWWLAD